MPRRHFDILARDEAGRLVLVAEVKGLQDGRRFALQDVTETVDTLGTEEDLPFVLVADREKIEVRRLRRGRLTKELFAISTSDVIRTYDLDADVASIGEFYLESLIRGWLTDLVMEWSGHNPPGKDELGRLGLPAVLEDTDLVRGSSSSSSSSGMPFE